MHTYNGETYTDVQRNLADRSGWGTGPWDHEPDKLIWADPYSTLQCGIIRSLIGALCGYVAVGPNHPWFGKHYDDCSTTAHGGLTYSGPINELLEPTDTTNDLWVFGFDCAHLGDATPNEYHVASVMKALGQDCPTPTGTYRNVGYVRDQVIRLAEQLLRVQQGLPTEYIT